MATSATQVIALMTVKKETPGKIVFEETDGSSHLDTIGVPLNIYLPKITVRNLLAGAEEITMLIEAGHVDIAAAATS